MGFKDRAEGFMGFRGRVGKFWSLGTWLGIFARTKLDAVRFSNGVFTILERHRSFSFKAAPAGLHKLLF